MRKCKGIEIQAVGLAPRRMEREMMFCVLRHLMGAKPHNILPGK
jgi:hypothetical protein